MKNKFRELEAIRGFAGVYIVLHHIFQTSLYLKSLPISYLFRFGQEAVILFFILSGFVIEYSFSKGADKTFKTYFFKRFNRIYIPLIIVFVLHYVFVYAGLSLGQPTLDNLFGNLLMLQDLGPLKPNVAFAPYLGNSPLWSLSYEWWFYMIYYGGVCIFKREALKVLMVVGILATISYLIYPFWMNRIFMYLMIWCLGASIARLYLRRVAITFRNLRFVLISISISTVLLFFNWLFNQDAIHEIIKFKGGFGPGVSPFLGFRHFSFTLLAITLGVLWHKSRWKFFKATVGLFEPFSKVSFGLYITHWFVICKANYLDFIGNLFVRYTCYILVCLIISYLIELVIYPRLNALVLHMVKKYSVSKAAYVEKLSKYS